MPICTVGHFCEHTQAMDRQKQEPDSQFLFSSMPYVDANRVETSLYRSAK
jgi:hypothetical protein